MARKFTLCITSECNLRCSYCYIDKQPARMSPTIAARTIDMIFAMARDEETVNIAFFGGEPLLAFDLVRAIVDEIEGHPAFSRERVTLSLVTNATLLDDRITDYFAAHDIVLCVSCDGPPAVHDRFRAYRNGEGSGSQVVAALSAALKRLPMVLVNAVYRPETLDALPETVAFLSGVGVRQIYINPDVAAPWRASDAAKLPKIYGAIGDWYIDVHQRADPHFLSVIDAKITTILQGGYQDDDRCHMGDREIAFSAEGWIYPCERLVGDGRGGRNCIGRVGGGRHATPAFQTDSAARADAPCATCEVKPFCMTWCGCSNFLATGRYDGMSPFLCASERALIATAARVCQRLEEARPGFFFDRFAHRRAPPNRTHSPAVSTMSATASES